MGTRTSTFGTTRRESHDSSAFYKRFDEVVESNDQTVNTPAELDKIYPYSCENMKQVASNCVDLIVTSPPYNTGKDYDLDQPFDDYLDLLYGVFEECHRVLKPGGRAAINVANLGKKPYIALSSYVNAICLDIGYLPRAEIIWVKGKGASGSCAWGSFQSASNPVLRDVHEYILIYSKGRYQKIDKGVSTIKKDDFLRDTLSVWYMPPALATKVGHPCPFPLELPQRLIELYTYEGDVVLDPFMGSGTSAMAAVITGRHYLGFENNEGYYLRSLDRIEGLKGNQDAR